MLVLAAHNNSDVFNGNRTVPYHRKPTLVSLLFSKGYSVCGWSSTFVTIRFSNWILLEINRLYCVSSSFKSTCPPSSSSSLPRCVSPVYYMWDPTALLPPAVTPGYCCGRIMCSVPQNNRIFIENPIFVFYIECVLPAIKWLHVITADGGYSPVRAWF